MVWGCGIPKYSGPCNVGCLDIMTKGVVDKPSSLHPKTLCSSQLGSFIRLFYPCDPSSSSSEFTESRWLPEKQKQSYVNGFIQHLKLSVSVFGWLANWLTRM